MSSHASWQKELLEIQRFGCVRSSRRPLSSDHCVSVTDGDDWPSGSLQVHRGEANWTTSLDLIVQIAERIASSDNLSLLFTHPSVTRAIRRSLYRRLEVGLLTLEPDLAISRLFNTCEALCAVSAHPVRSRLELESLGVEARGHDTHPYSYRSTF